MEMTGVKIREQHESTDKAVMALYLLSGMTSLIYQVVWFRRLALLFGSTLLASSTVLAVFFLGLSLGSTFFGRLSDRVQRHIRLYGILEGAIGIYALLFPFLLDSTSDLYNQLVREAAPGTRHLFRTLISGILLLPPTFLMGGTYPLILKDRVKTFSTANQKLAVLYAVNTTGAVAGTLISGYFLIAWFGLFKTTLFASTINILIFVAAWTLQQRRNETDDSASLNSEPDADQRSTGRTKLILISTFLSGLASLTYEVVWTRAFTSYFGSSVYAFSAIVATFLIGIALGSLYFRYRYSHENPLVSFGEIQLRIALSVVLFCILFMKLPVLILWGVRHIDARDSFFSYQLLQFTVLLIAMIYTTLNLGAAFPAANSAYLTGLPSLGARAGRFYAANTAGAIFGALVTGFFLIPELGMENTLWLAFFINLIVGCSVLFYTKSIDKVAIGWIAACVILFFLAPGWEKSVLNSGLYATAYTLAKNQDRMSATKLETAGRRLMQQNGIPEPATTTLPVEPPAKSYDIIYFDEGITSTISVVKDDQQIRSLMINGKADASTSRLGDMRTQLLLGHLPVLLSRNIPRSALIIGLGSGTTLGSVQRYDIPNIECVEIEPAVVTAARTYFSDVNHNALNDSRLKLIVDDARNYLERTKSRYDLVTSEPSNLWMAGCSNLFTTEFFTTVKKRLNTGGLMCQWIHLYQISVDDVRTFLKTYQSVFPHVSIWIDQTDMLAIGSDQPIIVHPPTLAARLAIPQLQTELKPSRLATVGELLPLFTADSNMVRVFAQRGLINTDDRPVLEFSAPKSLLQINADQIVRELVNSRPAKK